MIATDKDRNGARSRQIVSPSANRPDPALNFPVVLAVVRRGVVERGNTVYCQVAVVFDRKAEPFEQGQKAGGSQRVRSHQRSVLRRPDFDRGAENGDLLLLF